MLNIGLSRSLLHLQGKHVRNARLLACNIKVVFVAQRHGLAPDRSFPGQDQLACQFHICSPLRKCQSHPAFISFASIACPVSWRFVYICVCKWWENGRNQVKSDNKRRGSEKTSGEQSKLLCAFLVLCADYFWTKSEQKLT